MSDTVKAALAEWVGALRGALEWHAETGEDALAVPAEFALPPLGEIAPAAPAEAAPAPTQGAQAAPTQGALAEPSARTLAEPAARALAPVDRPAPRSAATHVASAGPLPDGPLVDTVVWGNPWAGAVFVLEAGTPEAPAGEDARFPLGGEAGALLMRMIQAMKLGWADVFLVCCVRGPSALRATEMKPAVARALALAPRRVLVPMGVTATRALIDTDATMPRLRGRRFEGPNGVVVRPTFTPDALVQNPKLKADAWKDLQGVMRELTR